jgi:hypothetical protein
VQVYRMTQTHRAPLQAGRIYAARTGIIVGG